MPIITIIVPVYNSENYISQCIESVINQDYTEWELLLIDDGSTDTSAEICNSYAGIERRIRLIKKENGGVSSARNLGISQARGDFVTFIDADDYVDKDYCSLLLKSIGQNVGMIILGMRRFLKDGSLQPIRHRMEDGTYSFASIARYTIDDGTLSGFTFDSSCSVLYRKELIEKNHLRFDESIRFNEDGLFNAEYILHCRATIIINYEYTPYIYRYNNESVSHTIDVMSIIYKHNMEAIEHKLKLFAVEIPEANILEQLEKRRAALALDKLIYLAGKGDLSSKIVRDIISDSLNCKILNSLNRNKMNKRKYCLCIAIYFRQYLLLSSILKKIYAKK